jgi:hypothetical protein
MATDVGSALGARAALFGLVAGLGAGVCTSEGVTVEVEGVGEEALFEGADVLSSCANVELTSAADMASTTATMIARRRWNGRVLRVRLPANSLAIGLVSQPSRNSV